MDERDEALAAALMTALGALTAYVRIIRPWTKRWGATNAEVAMELPGDAIVVRADYVATRAITIDASADDVWPWLIYRPVEVDDDADLHGETGDRLSGR
jgi:hypothetical protein